jgi:Cu(I)/Ag(I) efflux system membrane fusion protein
MNGKVLFITLAATFAVGFGGYALYRFGVDRGMQIGAAAPAARIAASSASTAQKAGDIDPATGKKVLYWHDPMVPGQKFDKPGKSPFMDMQLVPVYAEGGGDESAVAISSRVQQNLGIRTAEVKAGTLTSTVEAV